jgi:NADPH2:quinone reductase
MRVAEVERFGDPEVLVTKQVPDPVAGRGEVVVEVSAVDTLFVETQIRRGWGREFFLVQPPYVPGGGVAGQVISVGPGVDPGWVGRRVLAVTGEGGGYAELALTSVAGLVPVPDGLGLPEAAALLHDGTTALGLADGTGIRAGEWALVTAAAGGCRLPPAE